MYYGLYWDDIMFRTQEKATADIPEDIHTSNITQTEHIEHARPPTHILAYTYIHICHVSYISQCHIFSNNATPPNWVNEHPNIRACEAILTQPTTASLPASQDLRKELGGRETGRITDTQSHPGTDQKKLAFYGCWFISHSVYLFTFNVEGVLISIQRIITSTSSLLRN